MIHVKRALMAALTIIPFAATTLPAAAEKLTFAHGFQDNHFWSSQIIKPWMACVQGRAADMEFDYYPGGQVVKYADSLNAMNTGLTQISTISIGYVSSEMPLNGISMLPDMGDSSVQMASAYRKMLDDKTPFFEEFTQNKVYPLIANLFPVYQLVLRSEPLKSIEDLQGKKIRSSGGALTLTVSSLDAAPVEMASSEVYVAMQNRTVDGALAALSSVKPYNLQELAKSFSTNGKFGSFATLLAIDLNTLESLPDVTQTAFKECGLEVERAVAVYLDDENETLKSEFESLGMIGFAFSDEDVAKMVAKLKPVTTDYLGRLTARGMPAQEVYNQYVSALGR